MWVHTWAQTLVILLVYVTKGNTLLKEYESQFTKDETSIGTRILTSMMINMGNSDPVSQKPNPIAMKNYQWVKEEIEKLTCS